MLQIKIEDFAALTKVIEQYNSKGCNSNCFLLPDEYHKLIGEGCLYSMQGKRNLFLLVNKGNCLRIYFFINDLSEPFECHKSQPLMLEILYKGNLPKEMVEYWERYGFRQNLIRNLYEVPYKEMTLLAKNEEVTVTLADTVHEGIFAQQLFNAAFDPYSGDFISDTEVHTLVCKKCLLIAKMKGEPVGALHFYLAGKKAWIGHVAVAPSAQGQGIGVALVNRFISINHDAGATRFSCWVQRQNEVAVGMYHRFGFRPIGKATLSMIQTI